MSELSIQRCDRCGTGLFPERLRCPHCGGCSFTDIPAGDGIVEEETALRRAAGGGENEVRLGSVRLASGPVVIARMGDQAVGAAVHLVVDPHGAIWARGRTAEAAPAPTQ